MNRTPTAATSPINANTDVTPAQIARHAARIAETRLHLQRAANEANSVIHIPALCALLPPEQYDAIIDAARTLKRLTDQADHSLAISTDDLLDQL